MGPPSFLFDFALVMALAGVGGWLFQRFGLSAVVGFIAAGVVAAPTTGLLRLSEGATVAMLADLGLVFLMFNMGLGLSFKRLRRLGLPLVVATIGGALLVGLTARATGAALGWPLIESAFLAGMVVVSSSAVLAKGVADAGLTHEKPGQLALGVTVLEDMVAVVAITVLGAYAASAGGSVKVPLVETIGGFGIFVLFLGLLGLLLVPRLLRWLSTNAAGELQTLLVAALLFGVALLAYAAGYSMALGAFVLGAIVAEAPERSPIARAFEGLRDVFSAMFFVAIGMRIDIGGFAAVWPGMLALGLGTVVVRFVGLSIALVLAGNPLRDALRAGLCLTPLGEFTFVIAQLGVSAAVLPPAMYPTAIGGALLTMLVGPVLMRHSDKIASALEARQPRWLKSALGLYRDAGDRLRRLQESSVLWKLLRPRLVQLAIQLGLAAGILIFLPLFWDMGLRELLPILLPQTRLRDILFWCALGLLLVGPLIAAWRNASALALLVAEGLTTGLPRERFLRPFVDLGLRLIAALGIFLMVWALLPHGTGTVVLAIGFLVSILFAVLFGWRRLVTFHSSLEVELNKALAMPAPGMSAPPWLRPHKREWNLHIEEVVLPDNAALAGQSLADLRLRTQFGVNVVGVSRQGYPIGAPVPDTRLYPLDHLLLLGRPEAVAKARDFLQRSRTTALDGVTFEDVGMDEVPVPEACPRAGLSLGALDMARVTGVQLVGLRRGGRNILNPPASELLLEGDDLLVVGSPSAVSRFRHWLAGREGAPAESAQEPIEAAAASSSAPAPDAR